MCNKVKFVFGQSFMEQWYAFGLTIENRQESINDITYCLRNAPDNNYVKKFSGSTIEGTGVDIKYLFTPDNYQKGKSGNFQTIYFVYDASINHLFYLTVYPKMKKATLSRREKHLIKKFIEAIKRDRKEK